MPPAIERVGSEIATRYFVAASARLGAAPESWRCRGSNGEDLLLFYYPDAALSGSAAQKFMSEVPYWKGIEHPRMLALSDAGVDAKGAVYGVCAMPEGRTLAEHLSTLGALSHRDAIAVISDALQGLAALHDRGIVHRGITSADIVVSRGPNGRYRGSLLLAGMLGAVAHRRERGSRSNALGSPQHMAPEQCRGEEPTTETDVWAMGVLLYESLRGSCPFDGESPLEVIAEVLSGDPPSLVGKVPDALRRVIERSLRKRSADRPPDAEALCLMLGAAEAELNEVDNAPRGSVASPISTRLEAHGVPRGVIAELPIDDLDALVASVRAESSPATSFDLEFEEQRGPTAPTSATSSSFDLDFGSLGVPVPSVPPGAMPGHALPPPPGAPVVALASTQSPPAQEAAGLFASLDTGAPGDAARSNAASSKARGADSVTHTTMSHEVVDRTRVSIPVRAKTINPYVAFLGVGAVTGLLAYGAWKFTDIGRTRPPAFALPPDELAAQARHHDDPDGPGETPGDSQAPSVNAAPPESQARVEFGEQLALALPTGLGREDATLFIRHVTTAALSDAANTPGFASCSTGKIYLHPGGLTSTLRSAALEVRCESADLALIPDIDGDQAPDVVAVALSGDALLVIGSRNFRVIKRIPQIGLTAVIAGLSRTDRRRTEPCVVMFAAPSNDRASLIAVGVRTARSLWRSPPGIVPASARDYGFALGQDTNGDGVADLAVGVLREGNHCVQLVSGADGAALWPAPRCFDGASMQSITVGADANGDQRADVLVGNGTDNRARLLSGVDGAELRSIGPEESGDGVSFALGALAMPDIARDGFADIAVTHTRAAGAALEVFSANDGHLVARRPIAVQPSLGAPLRVQYAEGFAFPGSRSIVVASPLGVSILGAASRPEVRDLSAPSAAPAP